MSGAPSITSKRSLSSSSLKYFHQQIGNKQQQQQQQSSRSCTSITNFIMRQAAARRTATPRARRLALLMVLGGPMLIAFSQQASRLSRISRTLFVTEDTLPINNNAGEPQGDEHAAMAKSSSSSRSTSSHDSKDWGSSSSSSIREWGCNRSETPFIFVHIGKAGGGGVRARLAASALNYKRPNWNRIGLDKTYYYPMYDNDAKDDGDGDANTLLLHKGQFLSSKIMNFIPPQAIAFKGDFQFEGILPCAATTALGQAIACPSIAVQPSRCNQQQQQQQPPTVTSTGDNNDDDACSMQYLVYAGHNLLFSELHWLPNDYLIEKWWKKYAAKTTKVSQEDANVIESLIRNRHKAVGVSWDVPATATTKSSTSLMLECPPGPLHDRGGYRSNYTTCYQPKEMVIDQLSNQILAGNQGHDPLFHQAQLLSSLPVLRVTVLREPFGWLMSKFFWHEIHPSTPPHNHNNNVVTTNVTWISSDRGEQRNNEQFIRNEMANKPPPPLPFVKCDDIDYAANGGGGGGSGGLGWASYRAITYMAYLCGEHCLAGYTTGQLSLAQIEQQAAYHLRNSFAVVGLLQETDQFYDMVSKRVSYMDTTLNPEVVGKKHTSASGGGDNDKEAKRCKAMYQDQNFQQQLLEASPEVAALHRLYQIGVEVNEFQRNELESCTTATTTTSVS